jgi:hypothetical protein
LPIPPKPEIKKEEEKKVEEVQPEVTAANQKNKLLALMGGA